MFFQTLPNAVCVRAVSSLNAAQCLVNCIPGLSSPVSIVSPRKRASSSLYRICTLSSMVMCAVAARRFCLSPRHPLSRMRWQRATAFAMSNVMKYRFATTLQLHRSFRVEGPSRAFCSATFVWDVRTHTKLRVWRPSSLCWTRAVVSLQLRWFM